MSRDSGHNKKINRVIDANINRCKEGLRVCEEITRFVLNNRTLTSKFKRLRHEIGCLARAIPFIILLEERESKKDIGKDIYANELKRGGVRDIFFANMQRAKESVRVLEEFSKIKNIGLAVKFKNIRYRLYEIEKETYQRFPSLSGNR